MCRKKFFLGVVLSVLLPFSGGSAQALPLFDFSSQSGMTDSEGMTLGYTFTVFNTIAVDGIGIFAIESVGLQSVHNLALWKMSDPDNPLITGIVNPSPPPPASTGMSDFPGGLYIYDDVFLMLVPGEYVLGASYGPGNSNKDMALLAQDTFANSPDVMFGMGVFGFQTDSKIVFPDLPSGGDFFGPALRISATIPEPLTLALATIGLAGFFVRRPKDR